VNDEDIDRLLRALSDATRRRLLDRLRDAPGLTQGQLAEGFTQSRQALS
jgi:DNA-binding transcriptional ArsR family regulator